MELYEEKLQTIRANVPKVYSAGYDEGYAAGEQTAGSEPEKTITLIDTVTGAKYTLQVTDGKLTMEEVTE